MLIQAAEREPQLLKFIADKYDQEICERAVEKKGWTLSFVPDQYKKQEMCEKVIEDNPIPTNQTIFLFSIRHRRRVKWQLTNIHGC